MRSMFKEPVMDLIYLGAAVLCWLAAWGLALGCARLQPAIKTAGLKT